MNCWQSDTNLTAGNLTPNELLHVHHLKEKVSPPARSHRARVGEGEGIVSKLLVILRVDGTHQSYLLVLSSKRADHVHGYHPVLCH